MDSDFWHKRWQNNELGWHEGDVNGLLAAHFDDWASAGGQRVFLPLCGKTRDIAWLLSAGHRVAGIELSRAAVEQLFAELGIEPVISRHGDLEHFQAEGIDIFAGDLFELSAQALGPLDVVYDRAALVALPDGMRDRYSAYLMELTGRAPQFLLCFEYDQREMDGPPFSVTGDEVRRHYGEHYDVQLIASREVDGGLKGICAATEIAWSLQSPD